jgi:GH15 family glucan-1,4-alpha-glucosidase
MQKIQDYAIIGNGRSAALVSKNGSIDWLCWPRFDSPSLFANILDQKIGGTWKISPISPAKIQRKYIEETNVLQTYFSTDSGIIIITDFMPVFSEEEKKHSLQPEHEIIRRIECEQGEVEIQIDFNPRPNYAREKPVLHDAEKLGFRMEIDRQLITLRSDINLILQKNGSAFASLKMMAGQRFDFSLTYTSEGPAVLPLLGDLISQKLALTINWWQKWSNRMKYSGPYRTQVMRSALALKLLGHAPSGSFIAALTTSLPERIGHNLNWDYRFCWLRDAAFTVRALFGLGYIEEAEAFVSWLLHSTRLTLPELKVLYDVYGEDIHNDVVLPHLKGYEASSPVRIGNGVRSFFELDVYGEVIEAVTHLVRAGRVLDHETQKMLRGFGEYVCKNWQKPDTGIWEKMHPLKHYTHSKLMCWVALDRLIEIHKLGQIKNIPLDTFIENRSLIRNEIEEKSWNSKIQSYTQIFEGEELDSTVLVMALYEFEEASSARMQQTFQRIQEKLSPVPGLIYRYQKSIQEGEGTFGLCSFWNAEFLARGGGSIQNAHKAFNQILLYANDIGLFSEEIDPKTGDALGNFPQAFTHIGLINTALSLLEREKKEK